MPATPRLSRRTFTLSALGVGSTYVLAACQADTIAAPQTQDGQPDANLLRSVLAAEQGALELCRVAARRHRQLQRVLAQPERFHAEHVRLLHDGVAEPQKVNRPRVPQGTAAALAAVIAVEQQLVRQHSRLSMKARSGEVARLLAGLSAAAAQQAQVLGSVTVK